MRQSVVVLVAVAAVFLGSCGRQGIGEMERESQTIDLENAQSVRAELRMGAGETTVDLTGSYDRDIAASIEGGVGEATVQLPSEIGVRVNAEGGLGQINAEGLHREGDAYVNDAYGDSDVTLDVDVRGGVGKINLEVV